VSEENGAHTKRDSIDLLTNKESRKVRPMTQRKGIGGFLERLDIIQSDDSPSESVAVGDPSTPAPAPVAAQATTIAPTTGSSDPEMIAKIRASVTATTHAPRLASFLLNLETAKQAFPNDQRSAANAALAFSKLSPADLRDELSKAVAAALIEAENKIKGDIRQQRERLTAELGSQTQEHQSTIASLEQQIKALQDKLGTAQGALSSIDSTRSQRTTAINGSEATALASLAAVKTELNSISNMLP
jgi:hypothetical protein